MAKTKIGLQMTDQNPSWRPVTFVSESIDKIRRDLMTQMIRRIYPQPEGGKFVQMAPASLYWHCPEGSDPRRKWRCSYGTVGDMLWVRQVWARVEPSPQIMEDYGLPLDWKVAKNPVLQDYWRKRIIFMSDFPGKQPEECGCGATDNVWRSPGTMPRWASQLTLKITEIHALPIQEISYDDVCSADNETTAEEWAFNTWVWRITFQKVEKGTS